MKISYIKEYHPTNGTTYHQRLTVSPSEFNTINEKSKNFYKSIENDTKNAHKITSEQIKILYFCKPLDENNTPAKNKYFLTLTQLNFIYLFFTPARLKNNYNTIIKQILSKVKKKRTENINSLSFFIFKA